MEKKMLLTTIALFFIANCTLTSLIYAQSQLWSMAQYGGANDLGAIFKINKDGTGYDTAYSFTGMSAYPNGSLFQASNGLLYGMTLEGGTNGYGNLFSFNPVNGSYTDLVDFDKTHGAYPFGSLIQVGDSLYGMTNYGGAHEAGVLFSFSILTNTYIELVDFDNAHGAYPYGSLTQMGNVLYGMTEQGGSNGYGVIFSYNLSSGPSSYTDLFDFKNDDSPLGNLTLVGDSLYGMSSSGGTYYQGNIFSFNPATLNYTDLYDFDNAEIPTGNLLLAGGLLYGMAPAGGANGDGYIFSFNPVGLQFTDLQDFTNALPDYGAYPFGSLMQASNGLMYGMTYFGGGYSEGNIFSFDPSNPTTPPVDLRDLNYDGATFFDGTYPLYSNFIEVTFNATLNLKMFIEGYYLGGGMMTPVLQNELVSDDPDVVDTIYVSLVDSSALSINGDDEYVATVATAKGVLHVDGSASVTFPDSVVGHNYYVRVNHRNAVETWSAFTITMSPIMSYDFTGNASRAYGSNEVYVYEDGVWSFYSGDFNQDQNINIYDYPVYNYDVLKFAYGYYATDGNPWVPTAASGIYVTDLNGDGNIDIFDYPEYESNVHNYIYSVHP